MEKGYLDMEKGGQGVDGAMAGHQDGGWTEGGWLLLPKEKTTNDVKKIEKNQYQQPIILLCQLCLM